MENIVDKSIKSIQTKKEEIYGFLGTRTINKICFYEDGKLVKQEYKQEDSIDGWRVFEQTVLFDYDPEGYLCRKTCYEKGVEAPTIESYSKKVVSDGTVIIRSTSPEEDEYTPYEQYEFKDGKLVAEQFLSVQGYDVDGVFHYNEIRRVYDQSGQVVEEYDYTHPFYTHTHISTKEDGDTTTIIEEYYDLIPTDEDRSMWEDEKEPSSVDVKVIKRTVTGNIANIVVSDDSGELSNTTEVSECDEFGRILKMQIVSLSGDNKTETEIIYTR